jgi:hypothetical protein
MIYIRNFLSNIAIRLFVSSISTFVLFFKPNAKMSKMYFYMNILQESVPLIIREDNKNNDKKINNCRQA